MPKEDYQLPCGFIVNTDKAKDPGEHWVAIILLRRQRGEYFDSFGLPPLEKEIGNYLNERCANGWIYNSVSLQHPLSESCGRYSIAFLKNRFNNKSFISFIASFSPDTARHEIILS